MTSDARAKLKHIDALTKSKGWQHIREVMQQELVSAAMAIANDPNMTEKEVDFRRGSIWAGHQLLDLPNRLRMRLEAEAALDAPAKDDHTPGKS